jgi:CIC family chloride channel protein
MFLNSSKPRFRTQGALISIIVGLLTGLGAVGFRYLIEFFQRVFLENGHITLHSWYLPLVMGFAGLIVGLLIYYFAREAKGHGVPEVMLAVATNGGRIRGRVAILKSLASAICIGSGGSAGREGPIVQIGSALGSTIGQRLGLCDRQIPLLVACGASAGIAATFNAPIAGALFSLEVILLGFTQTAFSYVVLSSVAASVVGRAFLGDTPAFTIPLYSLGHRAEFLLYAGLGLLAAFVGILFTRSLYRLEDFFDALPIPEPVKPALGAALVGVVALSGLPQVMGVGYETITQVLEGELAIKLVLLLILGKLLATGLTLGSGGSGGVFAPSLFIGSMLGGAYGHFVHWLAPEIVTSPGGYALVGMAAVFAATAHAPMTAILILFELTGDYHIILPLMTSTVVATLVSSKLFKESVYTVKLKRRGIDLLETVERHDDPMRALKVADIMVSPFETVEREWPLTKLADTFKQTGLRGLVVADSQKRLQGVVTMADLEKARVDQTLVQDVMTSEVESVEASDSADVAVTIMGRLEVGTVPVLKDGVVIGAVNRHVLMKAYQENVHRP